MSDDAIPTAAAICPHCGCGDPTQFRLEYSCTLSVPVTKFTMRTPGVIVAHGEQIAATIDVNPDGANLYCMFCQEIAGEAYMRSELQHATDGPLFEDAGIGDDPDQAIRKIAQAAHDGPIADLINALEQMLALDADTPSDDSSTNQYARSALAETRQLFADLRLFAVPVEK